MEFIVQKLLPELRSGRRLTIAGSNVPAFSFQGAWDGGCALHATAMAIAMLGRLSDPLRVPSRRRGPEAAFWELAWPFYLSGVTLEELENLILELGWGLRPTVFEGSHPNVLRFCVQEVTMGRPVIVTWRELRRDARRCTRRLSSALKEDKLAGASQRAPCWLSIPPRPNRRSRLTTQD